MRATKCHLAINGFVWGTIEFSSCLWGVGKTVVIGFNWLLTEY